ncbi:MAG: hypothetical protein AAGD07_23085 [Planctomycetota bacterium]
MSSDASSLIADEGTPDRLIASLQLSLERLSDEERHAVRRLGVFQGGAMEAELLAIMEWDGRLSLRESGVTDADPDATFAERKATIWPALRRRLEEVALIEAESIPGVVPPFLRFHPTLAPMLRASLTPESTARRP